MILILHNFRQTLHKLVWRFSRFNKLSKVFILQVSLNVLIKFKNKYYGVLAYRNIKLCFPKYYQLRKRNFDFDYK